MAYELTNEEWSKPEELLPKKKMGRPCLDLRRTQNGKFMACFALRV